MSSNTKYRKETDLDAALNQVLNTMNLHFERYIFAIRYGACQGFKAEHWEQKVEDMKNEIAEIRKEAEFRLI